MAMILTKHEAEKVRPILLAIADLSNDPVIGADTDNIRMVLTCLNQEIQNLIDELQPFKSHIGKAKS